MERGFTHAVRQMNGLTARAEKRLLLWLAPRLPAWVHSDHLTGLAAASMVVAAAAYAFSSVNIALLHLVNLALVVNWFGDSLDGTLARVRRHERPRYGFYVDHVLDCAGIALLLIGMAAGGLMSWTWALGWVVAYFLVSIEVFLATYCLATFRMSFMGWGPTELRLLLIVGNLFAMRSPHVTILGDTWLLFDVGAAVAVPVLLLAFMTAAIRNGRALARAEPRPSEESSRYARSTPSSDAPQPPDRVAGERESPA